MPFIPWILALLACHGKDEPTTPVPVDPFADYVVDDSKYAAPLGEVVDDGEMTFAVDQLLVLLDPIDAPIEPVLTALDATLVGELPQLGLVQLRVDAVDATELEELRVQAEALADVELAAYNLVVDEWFTPSPDYCHDQDDNHVNLQENLRCAHADFDYYAAVPIYDEVFQSVPRHDVRVGVVDSGCQADIGEFDDVPMIDLDSPAGGLLDDNGHGTVVTALIAADNDGNSINGAASRVLGSKLHVGVAAHQGSTMGGLIALHRASLDFEAKVVNASWGMRTTPAAAPRQAEMFQRVFAVAPDTLFVFAAGNDGVEVTETNWMPQGQTANNLIKIGATAQCDANTRWTNSNHGPLVDFAAPGEKVPTVRYRPSRGIDDPLGPVYTPSGTSVATPLVTSSLAVLWSIDPDLPVEKAVAMMQRTTRGGPFDLGYGRVSLVTLPLQHALEMGVPPSVEELLDHDTVPEEIDLPGLIVNRICGGFDLSIEGVGGWHVGGSDKEVSGVFLYGSHTDMLLQSDEDFFTFALTLDGPFVLGSPYLYPTTLQGSFAQPMEYWSGNIIDGAMRLTNCAITERSPFVEDPMMLMVEGHGEGILEMLHPPDIYPEPHAFETQFSVPAMAMPGFDAATFEERCIDGRGSLPPVLDLDDVDPGELVISEVLFASTHGAYQWLEVVNVGVRPIDLGGLEVRTATDDAVIDRSVVLRPSDRAVLGNRREGDWTHPTLQPDAYWGNDVTLDPDGEQVAIARAGEPRDTTAAFDQASVGASWQLDPAWESVQTNDELGAWCRMPGVEAVDLATPAVPNTPCELMDLLEP